MEKENRKFQLLKIDEVAKILGTGERTCWRLLAEAEAGRGDFPKPLRLTPKIIRWRAEDIEAYIRANAAPFIPKSSRIALIKS